jgi:phenylpropionate dioxygenase-like ring-hydroxylating dioxygenase large terminal subunit
VTTSVRPITDSSATRRSQQGASIPFDWYYDPEIFDLELDRVFGHGWQYAGTTDRLPEPGSFFTSWIARTPIVVTRDHEGAVRAFANVCPHRGHQVAEGAGCRRTLQCRYHGWTFNLDGRLRKAPRADREETFTPGSVGMREFAVAAWGPLIFVSPDPTVPFDEATRELRAVAHERDFDPGRYPCRATREWPIECNWKVTLDNNTECYHCATVHRSFSSAYRVDADHYLVQAFNYAFTHESPMRASDNPGPAPDFHLYYLWPNFMVSGRRSEYFYTYHYRPVGPGRTLQVNDYFFPPDWTDSKVDEAIEEIAVIMREDWGVFESVQVGMSSRALDHGIVLPQEESLLCHFQKLLTEALAG